MNIVDHVVNFVLIYACCNIRIGLVVLGSSVAPLAAAAELQRLGASSQDIVMSHIGWMIYSGKFLCDSLD